MTAKSFFQTCARLFLWIGFTLLILVTSVLEVTAQGHRVIASVQHGSGAGVLAFMENGTVFLGNFGSHPGSWQEAGTVPAAQQIVVVAKTGGAGVLVITESGAVYRGSFGSIPATWNEATPFPANATATALSQLGTSTVLALTDDGRAFRGAFGLEPGTWTEVAPLPTTVANQRTDWSKVKRSYGKED